MTRLFVSAPASMILIAALVAVAPGSPAAAAEKKPGAASVSPPRPAPTGMTVPAMAPDLAVTMTPKITPVQFEGKNCADFRPGTVVVSNVGKGKAVGAGVGIYLRLGNGEFAMNAPQSPVTLEPGTSTTMVLDAGIFSLKWCPGEPPVTWRAWADDAKKITEPNEANNIADRTYPPPIPRQPKPKTRKQGSTP